jgi:DNA-directed RNA polymerase alpha subunit
MKRGWAVAERCDGCRFWGGFSGGAAVGECRRYPPRLDQDRLADPNDDGRFRGVWPETEAGDWCGEFRPSVSAVPTADEATLSMSVRDPKAGLSSRAGNILRQAGAKTLADAARLARWELAEMPGCGAGTVDEIVEKLAALGVRLRGDV